MDYLVPVLIGLAAGVSVNLLREKERLNRELSMQNVQFRRDILVTTLISEFLHEIRNPVHSLKAALEDSTPLLTTQQNAVVQQSLERFDTITQNFRRWGSAFDTIDPYEVTRFDSWLDRFMGESMRGPLREMGVNVRTETRPVNVRMHPILLEQALSILLTNACTALAAAKDKILRVTVAVDGTDGGVTLAVENNGTPFPPSTLANQGRAPAHSERGCGLGLLLLRKMVEQAGGEVRMENAAGFSRVAITLRGGPA